MPQIRQIVSWVITGIIWGMGAVLLGKAWVFQKSLSDPISSYLEFTLMFVITFYPLVLFAVKSLVNGAILGSHKLPRSAFES